MHHSISSSAMCRSNKARTRYSAATDDSLTTAFADNRPTDSRGRNTQKPAEAVCLETVSDIPTASSRTIHRHGDIEALNLRLHSSTTAASVHSETTPLPGNLRNPNLPPPQSCSIEGHAHDVQEACPIPLEWEAVGQLASDPASCAEQT